MVDISIFTEQLVNGITVGTVYVLLAIGLSIIFGVMDVINFAHGEFYALGAYFAVAIVATGSGFWVALLVAPILVGSIGAVVERTTIRRLYGRDPLYHILLTFGLVLILNDLIIEIWGRQPKQLSAPASLTQPLSAFGFSYSSYNLFMIGFGGLLALGTYVWLKKSRFGMIIRAGAQDRDMVENLGIHIDRYYTLVFALGTALAGAGGVVLGAYQGVGTGMGNSVIVQMFIIVVLGGLGSFAGAVIMGLLVGIIQSFSTVYVPAFSDIILFAIMITVLLVRPRGLFGHPEWQGSHKTESGLIYGDLGAVFSERTLRWTKQGTLVMLALVPVYASVADSAYTMTLLTDIFIWAIFALSLDIVLGYAGLVSFGHALFYGLGTYVAVLVMLHLTPSIIVALLLAVLVSMLIAGIIGHLSIRVSGVYFAMITLAFAQLFYNIVRKLEITGGSDGLFGADAFYGIAGIGVDIDSIEFALGPIVVTGNILHYYFLLAITVGAYLITRRVLRTAFGRVLKGIRENEQRAQFVGFNVTVYKRKAFIISGALGGLAGGLYATRYGGAAPEFLHWINSGKLIVMTVLGGVGTLVGPMLGAGVYIWFEDSLSSFMEQWQLVLGLIFVLFVLFVPRGLISLPELFGQRYASRQDPPGSATIRPSPEEEVESDD